MNNILFLIKDYNLSILNDTAYKVDEELYDGFELNMAMNLGLLYDLTEDTGFFRSPGIGDLYTVGVEMYMIMPIGFRKVEWGDIVNIAKFSRGIDKALEIYKGRESRAFRMPFEDEVIFMLDVDVFHTGTMVNVLVVLRQEENLNFLKELQIDHNSEFVYDILVDNDVYMGTLSKNEAGEWVQIEGYLDGEAVYKVAKAINENVEDEFDRGYNYYNDTDDEDLHEEKNGDDPVN